MKKVLIGIIIAILIVCIVLICNKTITKNEGTNELDTNQENVDKKVFEDPQTITYEIKGKEQYKLTKEDEEFDLILDKLNSSLIEGYTSRQAAVDNGFSVGLLIMDIEEDIYSKYSVLRLLYSDIYEIDIIFGEGGVLDVIYVEDGKTSCFGAFDRNTQDEIQEYLDNI